MPTVRIEHSVPNYEMWKAVFDSDPADRKGSGVRSYEVLRAQDDPNYVLVDLDFETLGDAEKFLRSMELLWEGPGKAVMQNPRSRIAESVEVIQLKDLQPA